MLNPAALTSSQIKPEDYFIECILQVPEGNAANARLRRKNRHPPRAWRELDKTNLEITARRRFFAASFPLGERSTQGTGHPKQREQEQGGAIRSVE